VKLKIRSLLSTISRIQGHTSTQVDGQFTSESGCFCRRFWRLLYLNVKHKTGLGSTSLLPDLSIRLGIRNRCSKEVEIEDQENCPLPSRNSRPQESNGSPSGRVESARRTTWRHDPPACIAINDRKPESTSAKTLRVHLYAPDDLARLIRG